MGLEENPSGFSDHEDCRKQLGGSVDFNGYLIYETRSLGDNRLKQNWASGVLPIL